MWVMWVILGTFCHKMVRSLDIFAHYVWHGSVQSLSRVQLFAIPWTAAHQASLSITNSQSLPKPMSIESVMPSNHLILCCPISSSVVPFSSCPQSFSVFSNESAIPIRWPKYWSFSFSISLFFLLFFSLGSVLFRNFFSDCTHIWTCWSTINLQDCVSFRYIA